MAARSSAAPRELKQRFERLTEYAAPETWRWLAALSAERRLGRSTLERLGASDAELRRALESGLVMAVGEVRPVELRLSATAESAFAVAPEFEQLVLRRSAALGVLDDAVTSAVQLLGHRSVGRRVCELARGRLPRPTKGRGSGSEDIEADLREAIASPFDAIWFTKTWGEQAPPIASRVLEQSLGTLDDVTELYAWAVVTDVAGADRMAEVLTAHALYRDDEEQAERLLASLSAPSSIGGRAALELLRGRVERAQKLIDECVAWSGGNVPRATLWTPMLALLLTVRHQEEADALANKWLRARGTSLSLKPVARALSRLQDARRDPDARFARIDPHRVSSSASAWEVLLLGLTVFAFQERSSSRVSWPHVLVERGAQWFHHGYLYFARQAFLLARAIDRAEFERAWDRAEAARELRISAQWLEERTGDVCQLVRPRRAWEIGLQVLDQLSFDEEPPESQQRLEWYVEPRTARVHRPGLQRYSAGTGFQLLRRLSLSEAADLYDDLPDDDRRVLDVVRTHLREPELEDAVLELAPRLLDALVGHTRVVDGTRGRAPIEVARAVCQLSTREEADHLCIEVNPPGLGPGLNVVKEGDSRLLVVRLAPSMQRVLEAVGEGLRVPMAEAPRALEVLSKLAETVPVNSEHLGSERVVPANARPCLRVSSVAGAWLVEGGVKPFGPNGRFFVTGTGPSVLTRARHGQLERLDRDFVDETRQMNDLLATCATLRSLVEGPDERVAGESDLSWSLSGDGLLELLANLRDGGHEVDFEWPTSPPVVLRGTVSSASLQGSLRAKKGWYLLSGEVAIDDMTTLNLSELVRLPTVCRGRFVQLPSGAYVELEARVRRVMSLLALGQKSKGKDAGLRVARAHLPALRQVLSQDQFEFDADVQMALSGFEQSRSEEYAPPPTLQAQLRPYQLEGYRWLRRLAQLGLGACLADDMGLGKTVQVLALLASRPRGARHLVVAPTSVCTNWVRECQRFLPELVVTEYLGEARQRLADEVAAVGEATADSVSGAGHLIVASYGLMVEDCAALARVPWDTVVLDEAQYIKNAASQRARAAGMLEAQVRIVATGTPIENHLGDLWSIFNFVQPGLLGSWANFRTFFLKPIEREGDSVVRHALRKLLEPFILRREKGQVLKDLPALTTVRHEIRLSPQERTRYDLLRKEIHEKLRTAAGKRNNKLEILAEITRLRRFCCHPRLVFPEAPTETEKLDAFLRLAAELAENGRRTLVFSQYVDYLAMVRQRLDELGVGYEYLDGSTPKAERQACIDRFQGGAAMLFLISLKAGGLGLNLTAAETVVHLDPWWNPAVKAQATDRAHRIGQQHPVTVYEFVTKDTIEEDILRLHGKKRRLADALLEGGQRAAKLSTEELLELIDGAATGRVGSSGVGLPLTRQDAG